MGNLLKYNVQEKSKIWLDKMLEYRHKPAVMSAFKKSFSSTLEYKAWTHLGHISGAMGFDLSEHEEERQILRYMSAFFAMYYSGTNPEEDIDLKKKYFGTSLREMILKLKSEEGKSPDKIIEDNNRKLEILISISTPVRLCKKLTPLIGFMKRSEVSVDFRSLFVDIVYWGQETQLQWVSYFCKGEKNVSNTDNN